MRYGRSTHPHGPHSPGSFSNRTASPVSDGRKHAWIVSKVIELT